MTNVDDIVAMGYSKTQALKALKVAEGDLEQAVGFLLLSESSRADFIGASSSRLSIASDASTLSPSTDRAIRSIDSLSLRNEAKPGAYAVRPDAVTEIVNMGYSRGVAEDAMRFASGNLDQAINYLLLGESSRRQLGFTRSDSVSIDNDAAVAALLQQEEMRAVRGAAPTPASANSTAAAPSLPDSAMYHATTIRSNVDVPRMVVSSSFLRTDGAGTFCACAAASKFLEGGIITAEFINGILQTGTELFRKNSQTDLNVAKVLKKYGRSHLGIEASLAAYGFIEGTYLKLDPNHSLGLRKQLAMCRNAQGSGWQVLVMEVDAFESICIALPPKGSKNKFWCIDLYPRSCFHVSGAYARVHSTLLQLDESLEKILESVMGKSKDHQNFSIHTVKKVQI